MRVLLYSVSSFILRLTLPLTAFLIPLFFLPNTGDFFATNKQAVLVIIAAAATLAWAVQNVLRRQIRLSAGPAMVPLLLLALVYVLSSYLQSANAIESLRGRTSTILSLVLIYLATGSMLHSREHIVRVFAALFFSLTLASLVQLFAFFGLGQVLGIPWLSTRAFNPVGGPLPLVTLTITLIPAALILGLRSETPALKLVAFASVIFGAFASILAGSILIPSGDTPLALLPLSAGWTVAVEIFKNPRTALLGTGPETFATTFAVLKPLALNATPVWNVRFTNSSNEMLTILTTTGLLGFGAYLWALGGSFLKSVSVGNRNPEALAIRLSLAVTLVLHFLIPLSPVLTMVAFLLLVLVTIDLKSEDKISDVILSFFAAKVVKAEKSELAPPPTKTKGTEVLPWILLLLTIALILAAFVLHVPAYAAKSVYYHSLQAAAANKGTETYNLQIQAVKLNPYDPNIRMAYSQTNLALANAIAAKGNLSDQDRTNVTQLIQQSIREAKAATILDPRNSLVFSNLAMIYRQLVNLAEGASNWTIASYTRAAQLEPTNPQLRLELGAVYYAQSNWDQAIQLFGQAVSLKPDWANAHYNLAAAYREKKDYANAAKELRGVLKLLDANAPDYGKAQEELADLEKKLKDQEETKTEETTNGQPKSTEPLTTPTPFPSPSVEPIQLPDEAGLNLTPTPGQ